LGWGVALFLALLSWRHGADATALALRIAAASIFSIATLWPRSLGLLERLIAVATYPLRWATSQLALVIIYFGLLTPLALFFRLVGRDEFEKSPDPARSTYWRPRSPAANRAQYLQQF
jgi:hypothetical protein